MDAKIPAIHGGKGSEDLVQEILKVTEELKGAVNDMNKKLDQALLRISTLEGMFRSYAKHQFRTEVDADEDDKIIDLTVGEQASTDKLSSKENPSSHSHANSFDCQSIERCTLDKKKTKGSSSDFHNEECRDGLDNSSKCQEIHPSKVAVRLRPRKVNPKLRSPLLKLTINKRLRENKGVSTEEAVCIQYVRHYCSASPETMLVHIGAYNAWVTAKNLKCLTIDKSKDGVMKWLDDRVMDAYSKLIMHQHASSVIGKRFHVCSILNCSLIPTLTRRNPPPNTPELVTLLTESDRVYFPMVVKRGRIKHWILLVKNNDRKMFQVLDSLWELSTYRDQIEKMVMGMNAILYESTHKDDVLSWEIIQEKDIPNQQDGCSCGLYVLKFIEFWNGFYLSEGFGKSDIHSFRLRVLVELLLAELNDIADVKQEIISLLPQ